VVSLSDRTLAPARTPRVREIEVAARDSGTFSAKSKKTLRVRDYDVVAFAATQPFRHPELDSGSRIFLVIPATIPNERGIGRP